MSVFLDGNDFLVSGIRLNDAQLEIAPNCEDFGEKVMLHLATSNMIRFETETSLVIVSKKPITVNLLWGEFSIFFEFKVTRKCSAFLRHASLVLKDFDNFLQRLSATTFTLRDTDVPLGESTAYSLSLPEFHYCEVYFCSKRVRNYEEIDRQIVQFVDLFQKETATVQHLGMNLLNVRGLSTVKQSLFDTISMKNSLLSLSLFNIQEQSYIDIVGKFLSNPCCKLNSLCLDLRTRTQFSTIYVNMALLTNTTLKTLQLRKFDIGSKRENPSIESALVQNQTLTKLCFQGRDYKEDYGFYDCLFNVVRNTNSIRTLQVPKDCFIDETFCDRFKDAMYANISIVDCAMHNNDNFPIAECNAVEFHDNAINRFMIDTTASMFIVGKCMDLMIPPYVLLEIVDWMPRRIFPEGYVNKIYSPVMHKVDHSKKINRIFSVYKSIQSVILNRKIHVARFISNEKVCLPSN